MNVNEIFNRLVNEIHTVVAAVNDENGFPVTSVIDIMLCKNEKLYFITARGKNFYNRLIKEKYLSLSGVKGESTMTSFSVSIRGKVRNIGQNMLCEVFSKNLYMEEIYPQPESRRALCVFEIYEGQGEIFDLSQKPIFRQSFVFGGSNKKVHGYFINNSCMGCFKCVSICPQNCIISSKIPFIIRQKNCLHCGNCAEICPEDAVEKR